MQGSEKIIVGLDIGTTKICAVVGEMLDDQISIIGVGSHPSTGLRKGSVVNIESTVDSIKKAVEDAGLECIRADDIIHSGVIDKPMYELLFGADVVVADLSSHL